MNHEPGTKVIVPKRRRRLVARVLRRADPSEGDAYWLETDEHIVLGVYLASEIQGPANDDRGVDDEATWSGTRSPSSLKLAWKHPSHSDVFDSLDEAHEAYPHVTRFHRVWAEPHGVLLSQRGDLRRIRFAIPRRRRKPVDDQATLSETARAIIARRQRQAVHSEAQLWRVVVTDIQALALQPDAEAALLRTAYLSVFGTLPSAS